MATLSESNQMSLAYERRLFASPATRPPVPCTLVTGFLGSGKTTLLKHILATKGDLRIAVLVNDFAQANIDSSLLRTTQAAASLGLPQPPTLSHGCACCDISEEFRAAVQGVLDRRGEFDYLVVETSGLSDPQPIAKALDELGAHLSAVVAVVDAEALPAMLESGVARKQLAVADLVIVNKCDLVSLGGVSDVEDRIEVVTGGTKAVRSRYARVPLELVLDVDIHRMASQLTQTANGSNGYLSHERVVTPVKMSVVGGKGPVSRRSKALSSPGVITERAIQAKANGHRSRSGGAAFAHPSNERDFQLSAAESSGSGVTMPAGRAAGHGASEFGSAHMLLETPLSLARFQRWILGQLMKASGVLRAKGVAWFAEDRSHRYVFQYSGRQRVDLHTDGRWESPPHSSIVLIGRDGSALPGLVSSLEACAQPTPLDARETDAAPSSSPAEGLRDRVRLDDRFKLVEASGRPASERVPAGPDAAGTLVRFVLRGDSLRGVDQSGLTAALIERVNGRREVVVGSVGIHSEGCVAQAVIDPAADVETIWAVIAEEAGKSRAAAFKNVHACRCDFTRA